MARIDKGNALTDDILQPGWTTTSDGFGLIVINATFKSDQNTGAFAPFVRGTAFPAGGYTYCKSHKGSISWDNLGVATLKVDYVGIDPAVNSGVRTRANCSSANGLTAENITSHPNFFEAAGGYTEGPIAGLPSDFGGAYDDSTLGPPVTVISAAVGPTFGKAVPVPSSEGYNGACFETGFGGRFIGFVDPSVPELYGKTQYLARTTTYSGVMYTTSISDVQALYGLLASATATNSWGIYQLLPAWAPVGSGDFGKRNLLSQINVEEYGLLYKIMYEIRYSKDGWPPNVYANI
jgi:hypothetical protein